MWVIQDLSSLNRLIPCHSFKMTSYPLVRQAPCQGTWLTSLDLLDAYWHFPIAKVTPEFLPFSISQVDFYVRAIPFSLSIASLNWYRNLCTNSKSVEIPEDIIFAHFTDKVINRKEAKLPQYESKRLFKEQDF